jgi:hypothetical protein
VTNMKPSSKRSAEARSVPACTLPGRLVFDMTTLRRLKDNRNYLMLRLIWQGLGIPDVDLPANAVLICQGSKYVAPKLFFEWLIS